MLAIFYTGDVRHNTKITYKNHEKLFNRIRELIGFNIYYFTRDDINRGLCPYDPQSGQYDPDNVYRRGQGGAVQVWDFGRSLQRTIEPYVMRLRTDLWFTESAISAIVNEINNLLANSGDIFYFGSDWLNENAGAEYKKLPVHLDIDKVVQDFVILARRDKLIPLEDLVVALDKLEPNKRRSGNKTFRYIIPFSYNTNEIDSCLREQHAIPYRILCQIWLVRRNYKKMPSDMDVCRDYIQSYIFDDKAKLSKKSNVYPHPMQSAINWYRSQKGWPIKEIKNGDWLSWQSE